MMTTRMMLISHATEDVAHRNDTAPTSVATNLPSAPPTHQVTKLYLMEHVNNWCSSRKRPHGLNYISSVRKGSHAHNNVQWQHRKLIPDIAADQQCQPETAVWHR